jgi:hypothetical protein
MQVKWGYKNVKTNVGASHGDLPHVANIGLLMQSSIYHISITIQPHDDGLRTETCIVTNNTGNNSEIII